MTKIAMITGAPGQDATLMARTLVADPLYSTVVVTARYSSSPGEERFKNLPSSPKLLLRTLDLCEPSGCSALLGEFKPDELYNFGAASHVGESFSAPLTSLRVNTEGVLNLLEGVRRVSPSTRFVQMSTSEMFGSNYTSCGAERFQNEDTPFAPNSPYAVSKLAAHNLVRVYRESYGVWGACAICFNHESPLRGENFVTQKICRWIGRFNAWKRKLGDAHLSFEPNFIVGGNLQFPKLRLGNVEARRDWGHAQDILEGLLLLSKLSRPQDLVFCTGSTWSVRDFLDLAFQYGGIPDWEDYVVFDRSLFRPCEVQYLRGDYTRAKTELGWSPRYTFSELVGEMVGAARCT